MNWKSRLLRPCGVCATAVAALALVAPRVAYAQPAASDETPPVNEQPAPPTGMPTVNVGGFRIHGFFVGSFSYNSQLQMVPEFAGGAQALTPGASTNFRFDKFGIAVTRVFAPWLSASAAAEVERHRDVHAHGFDPAFGCPGTAPCVERFGTEEPVTEVNLDRFMITAVAPVGNGLSLSVGRTDVPFGIERHDEPLILTATTSEVFQFGRPQRMTGFQTSYVFSPQVDVMGWVVNRWETETTHTSFDDNNESKSVGWRVGFTPLPRERLVNVGFGGFFGPERDHSDKRWVVAFDATASISRYLLAAEAIVGGEENVSFRKRGLPYPGPRRVGIDPRWFGLYVLQHFDPVEWFGLSLRYGLFHDPTGGGRASSRTCSRGHSRRCFTCRARYRILPITAWRTRGRGTRLTGST